MVKDGAFSHKIDYITIFHLVVELHREGSAPAACAADFFSRTIEHFQNVVQCGILDGVGPVDNRPSTD